VGNLPGTQEKVKKRNRGLNGGQQHSKEKKIDEYPAAGGKYLGNEKKN